MFTNFSWPYAKEKVDFPAGFRNVWDHLGKNWLLMVLYLTNFAASLQYMWQNNASHEIPCDYNEINKEARNSSPCSMKP